MNRPDETRPPRPWEKGGLPTDQIVKYVDSQWTFALELEHDDPGSSDSVEIAASIIDALTDAVEPLRLFLFVDVLEPDFRDSLTLSNPGLDEQHITLTREPFPPGVIPRERPSHLISALHAERITGDLIRQVLTKRLTEPPVTDGLLRWTAIQLDAAGYHIGHLPDQDTIEIPQESGGPHTFPLEHRDGRTYALTPIERAPFPPLDIEISCSELYTIDVNLVIWWTYHGSPEMPGHAYVINLIDTITRLGDHWKISETRLGSNIDPNYVRTLEVDANRPTNQLYDGTTRNEP